MFLTRKAVVRLCIALRLSFRNLSRHLLSLISYRGPCALEVPYGNKADAKKDRRLYARFGKMLKAEQAHGYLKGIYCLSAREDTADTYKI